MKRALSFQKNMAAEIGSASLVEKKKLTPLVAISFITILICCSFFSSFITAYQPDSQGDLVLDRYQPPSAEHLFGTDKFGRDVFSRVLAGGRISLSIAFGVVLIALTIGVFYGAAAAYAGGWVDMLLMRFLDFLMAFPAIFLIIAIIAIFRPGVVFLVLVLGLTGWMDTARLIRAEVLSVKERDYIMAARGLGFSHWRIIFRHLLPNSLTPVFVAVPLKIGEIILLESALSFLGIGVQPPTASWGNIINDGRAVMADAWWISLFPGLFIMATVISLNVISNMVRRRVIRES